jgi:5-carboxymethyl-2-hydroxymuconate isomerase
VAHVTIEWTANLDGAFDRRGLMEAIAAHLRDRSEGAFPIGGIRVRCYRVDEFVIADGKGIEDAFLNIDVKMGAGRSAEFRKQYFDTLFEHVRIFLHELFDQIPLALSLYVEEANGWKHNTIHRRLKAAERG